MHLQPNMQQTPAPGGAPASMKQPMQMGYMNPMVF